MNGYNMIIYTIYLIYIILILIDFDITILCGEESVWFMTYILPLILLFILFIVCIGYSLHIEGKRFWNLTGVYYGLIIISIITFIGLLLFYKYYMDKYTMDSIKSKVINKQFQILRYQYGRDSGDIGRELRLNGEHWQGIFARNNTKTLQEMWEILMTKSTETEIKNITKDIVHADINDTIDVYYNLLWYLCISDNPFGTGLSIREMKLVSSLSVSELEQILASAGNRYTGAKDRASLLFAVFSGQYIDDIQQDNRYEIVKNYKPNIVFNLVFNEYNIIDHNMGTYSRHAPYIYLGQKPTSAMENIISNITIDDNDELIDRLGLRLNSNLIDMNEEDKFRYIQGEISLYNNVLNRGEDTPQPPDLTLITDNMEINNILSYYTNDELVETYEPRNKWKCRNDLIRVIKDDLLGVPRWSFTNRYCNNDDTINILSGERHGDVDKNDINDITLSFGIHKNYQCYQINELEGSFRENDGIFMFGVPDWTGHNINVAREFSIDSIKQLLILLEDAPSIYNVDGLINKIKYGLDMLKSARAHTLHLKQEFGTFDERQKQIVKTYFSWMFMYSMWMRFWKGPGNPWPMTKINVTRERDRLKNQRSSPEERDEHIFIQEAVRTLIIETYESDKLLLDWINKLPTIYYDFETDDAKCATYPIKYVLDQIALGEYCMGFGSDTILKTSYYYILNIFDITHRHFDVFINQMIPVILDIEYRVVISQLQSLIQHNTIKSRVLNDRLTSLNAPLPSQPGFDPSQYQNNTHVN